MSEHHNEQLRALRQQAQELAAFVLVARATTAYMSTPEELRRYFLGGHALPSLKRDRRPFERIQDLGLVEFFVGEFMQWEKTTAGRVLHNHKRIAARLTDQGKIVYLNFLQDRQNEQNEIVTEKPKPETPNV